MRIIIRTNAAGECLRNVGVLYFKWVTNSEKGGFISRIRFVIVL